MEWIGGDFREWGGGGGKRRGVDVRGAKGQSRIE